MCFSKHSEPFDLRAAGNLPDVLPRGDVLWHKGMGLASTLQLGLSSFLPLHEIVGERANAARVCAVEYAKGLGRTHIIDPFCGKVCFVMLLTATCNILRLSTLP
jgi:hypothetical protein